MVVGRAFGGSAGQGVASMAGNVMHSVGNRALGGVPKDKKKDKALKKASRQQTSEMVPYAAAQAQTLQTPSAYQIPPNQLPPATIVYHYVPPSSQYPRGYYAPAPTERAAPPVFQQAPPIMQHQPMMIEQAPQQYQQMPPALAYHYADPQPQYYQGTPQQMMGQQGAPVPGAYRAQTFYEAPPNYQPSIQRAHTIAYR
jgi:hypothetical protein